MPHHDLYQYYTGIILRRISTQKAVNFEEWDGNLGYYEADICKYEHFQINWQLYIGIGEICKKKNRKREQESDSR